VLALALLGCIYALVTFFTVLSSGSRTALAPMSVQDEGLADNPAAQLNAATVNAWGWYNDSQAGSVEPVVSEVRQQNVKQTSLQMRLEGIIKSDRGDESVAIIAINKESGQYKSGAKLPLGARVYLRTIESDRIILDNNGSLEELLLFSKDMLQQRRSNARDPALDDPDSGLIDQSANTDVTEMMGLYRDKIRRDPGSINDIIKFSAYTEDGKLAGFQIGAVSNQQDFARLGLQDGDVVTHVNGVELSDYSKALNLYQEVGDLSEIRVQLIRQGQPQELVFRLPDKG
jgi:type II secretion system protein C